MDTKWTVQKMAEATGLSGDTLRYYEKIGLIDHVERAANGHRRYSQADVTWVEFLMRLRATGMSIQQMQHYADLRRQGEATLTERRQLLEAHYADVQQHIRQYEQLLGFIGDKIDTYRQMEHTHHARKQSTE